ncbi:hypothetical protein CYMTET_46314, partial [Cymbomonas tetramitiformis]
MADTPEAPGTPDVSEGAPVELSKSQQKKLAQKAEKEAKKKAKADAMAAEQAAARAAEENDPLKASYGDAPRVQSSEISGKVWTRVEDIDENSVGKTVLLRGRVHNVRGKGKSAFLVIRQSTATVQVVFFVDDVTVSKGMVKYVSGLTKESIVDIEGVINMPSEAISGCTQQVEMSAVKIHAISKSLAVLPFQ